jgi:predicted ATP-dependent endonuclease of OLD family
MQLTKLYLKNFRCFEETTVSPLDELSIFIGENDAGKTVLLDAIVRLVGGQSCVGDDCRKLSDGSIAEEVVLEGTFRLDSHDTLPDEYRSGEDNSELFLKKRFVAGATEVYVRGQGYSDERFDSFAGRDNQMALLREHDIAPGGKEEVRKEQREQLVREGKLTHVEREIPLPQFAVIADHMPRVDRVASYDYRNPESMVQRTLQSVAAGVVNPPNGEGTPTELEELQQVRIKIEGRLNEELAKAKVTLQTNHEKLEDVQVEPNIDFAKSVTTSALHLNLGEGFRAMDSFGEGTKRRLWMGLLEWERQATAGNASQSVIRLYDEPDANLHYEAQRQLFTNISEMASDPESRTQCFVCTHSVTLVNNAPTRAINLIRTEVNGARNVDRIRGPEDEEVVQFFGEIGRAVGLSNTVLLQERGFLVVEGESEADSVPKIYRKLYGSSMREDGLILVNLHTCSAWKSVLEMLLKNRLAMTHMLLDMDCQDPNSSARISSEAFVELGCEPEFESQQVSYIGDKEFEDAFSNEVILKALNEEFRREDGAEWVDKHIDSVRNCPDKFSDDLKIVVRRNCTHGLRSSVSKPSLAAAIAKQCNSEADVPRVLVEAFENLRERAGVSDE